MATDRTNGNGPGAGGTTGRTHKNHSQGTEGAPDALDSRDREDLVPWAVRLVTFEVAAAIELRGRITTAVRLLQQDADKQRILDVLEGRQPW